MLTRNQTAAGALVRKLIGDDVNKNCMRTVLMPALAVLVILQAGPAAAEEISLICSGTERSGTQSSNSTKRYVITEERLVDPADGQAICIDQKHNTAGICDITILSSEIAVVIPITKTNYHINRVTGAISVSYFNGAATFEGACSKAADQPKKF